MKILIAGYGSIGRRHLNNLIMLGENDLFLYRTHHSTLKDPMPEGITVETNLQKALSQRPRAVVVANPTALHLDVAIPAARMGCAILMEKPISHTLQNTDILQKELAAARGKFLTGFQYRFHPGLQRVKQWVEDERIGRVTSLKAHWGEYLPGWHPWEDYRTSYSARPDLGGGVVNTLCHPFDYLRWIIGEVESLAAVTSSKALDLAVEDTAEVILNFENRATGNVHLDYLQRPGEHTLKITGTEGQITWDNSSGIACRFDPATQVWEQFSPLEGFERNDLFLAEMRHFLNVVNDLENPVCTLEDGLAILRITQAIHQSAKEGCLVKF